MIVRKNVGEPVLGPVNRQVCCSTRLVPANMFQLLELLTEPEVAVCRHDPVVLGKVLQLDWSGSLDDGVRQADKICLSVCVVSEALGAGLTVELPDEKEGEEDDDDEDDGDGDADQDGRVVRVSTDGLGPGRLAELVDGSVGSDLERERDITIIITSIRLQSAVC